MWCNIISKIKMRGEGLHMAKFELSLAKDYVPSWNYLDGVRELFQNALDQQVEVEDNDMFYEYDEKEEVLRIGNKKSVLERSTLLLGATSKKDNEEAIGQFGEGYKVATLVLTREGHDVVFYNYGRKEVWRPRFVKSTRYGADVLTFFVDKKKVWNKVPNNDLTIEISNITKEQYEEIVKSNLHLQDEGEKVKTVRGDILLDKEQEGKVYVNGLYVRDFEEYQKGYDFKPEYLELDRDRKLVSDFDLKWLASSMWNEVEDDSLDDEIVEMIENNASDVQFYHSTVAYRDEGKHKDRANKAYDKFIKEYGEKAVPVSIGDDLGSIHEEYEPIMVEESYKSMIKESDYYVEIPVEKVKSVKERLEEWMGSVIHKLEREEVEEFYTILSRDE